MFPMKSVELEGSYVAIPNECWWLSCGSLSPYHAAGCSASIPLSYLLCM